MKNQEIIEKATSLGFGYDHHQHDLLMSTARDIKGVPGIVCEIGLREGGGMAGMMLVCIDNEDTNRLFLAIDPYGNITHKLSEHDHRKLDYNNDMKCRALKSFGSFCLDYKINFVHMCLDDLEFFKRFEDGVPTYSEDKYIEENYALVHLDGPHAVKELIDEINFFRSRVSVGGYIVLDDVQGHYDLTPAEQSLLQNGQYSLVKNDGKKASYKRVI